jgi:DNA mismatch repair protein MutS
MPRSIVQRAEEVLKRLESTKDRSTARALFEQNGNALTDNEDNGTGLVNLLTTAADGNGQYETGARLVALKQDYAWQTEEARLAAQKLEHNAGDSSDLDAIDVCAITPLDALNLLYVLQKKRKS